jgi:hypothetical protein
MKGDIHADRGYVGLPAHVGPALPAGSGATICGSRRSPPKKHLPIVTQGEDFDALEGVADLAIVRV